MQPSASGSWFTVKHSNLSHKIFVYMFAQVSLYIHTHTEQNLPEDINHLFHQEARDKHDVKLRVQPFLCLNQILMCLNFNHLGCNKGLVLLNVYDFYFGTYQCPMETVDTGFLGSKFINWRLCIVSLPLAPLRSVSLGSRYQSCSFFFCAFSRSLKFK